jgi:hypothetical protein
MSRPINKGLLAVPPSLLSCAVLLSYRWFGGNLGGNFLTALLRHLPGIAQNQRFQITRHRSVLLGLLAVPWCLAVTERSLPHFAFLPFPQTSSRTQGMGTTQRDRVAVPVASA